MNEFSAPPRDVRQLRDWIRTTPGGNVVLLRAFLGVTFVFAGLQKLANPAFFRSSDPTGIEAQMKAAQSTSPIGGLLGPAVHVAALLGIVIALGEIAVGLGTLVGFRSKIAARAGMLLSLMFFLTVSWSTTPYYYGADIVFLFAWTPFALNGAGAFSLDAWLAQRTAAAPAAAPTDQARAIERRDAVRRLGITGGLAALVVILGGMTDVIGRMVAGSRSAGATGAGTSGSGAGTTGATGTSGTTGTLSPGGTTSPTTGGTPKGKLIGPATEVSVGQAAAFTNDGSPAYVVQPSAGDYLGFSRICTHEGCTVNYVHSVQQFQCPCHGSIYSAKTGDVLGGPAPRPLPKIIVVKASDGNLYATD